jgi:N-acetyl-gamma-glutamyl-phosphate reductase
MTSTTVAVFGATGYTGQELVTLLAQHPNARLEIVTSESSHGRSLADVTSLRNNCILETTASAIEKMNSNTVAFLCLPHGQAEPIANAVLQRGGRVIDLSADFRMIPASSPKEFGQLRLSDRDTTPTRYGLCELEKDRLNDPKFNLTEARLIANPGCYPTSIILPLAPLLRRSAIQPDSIIIDSKSGTSGAGRAPKASLLLAEIHEDFSAYSPGRSHRHVPEINGYLEYYSGQKTDVIFTPHLLPIPRGILSTIYCRLNSVKFEKSDVVKIWQQTYSRTPFVWIFENELPSLARVTRTNRCAMGCMMSGDTLIIVSAIDNLLKGAAGQAVQNFNQMLGLDDQTGLESLI